MHTFKQVLSDVELVAGPKCGNRILSKIKNTMSDRHIVEKNFNDLLEDYRSGILPTIIESWEQMTPEEQGGTSTLNNFFCGMHLLVGMADVVSSVLLQWEAIHFDERVGAAALCMHVCTEIRVWCCAPCPNSLQKHCADMAVNKVEFTSHSLRISQQTA